MAANNKILGDLIKAIKTMEKGKMHAPWNKVAKTQIPYDDTIYGHGFRKSTMPATVKLYPAIVKAVEMYKNGARYHADSPEFRLVSRSMNLQNAVGGKKKNKEYFLELAWDDGSATVMHKQGNSIRISEMEADGTNNPVGEFKSFSEFKLAGIILLCLPEILEADAAEANGKLLQAINDLASFQNDFPTWIHDTDIPDLARESAFFLDAIFCYCNDLAKWEFADTSTGPASTADPVDALLTQNGFRGAEVVCSNPQVAFHYAFSNGTTDGGSTVMTIAEAKAMFSAFTSHRKWSAAELMMIPYFPDNTPVMAETIYLAKHILGTRNAVNPVCNAMWRGVTSYGKSTGVKQLACILNIPLMILTCHPGMEISEFKSSFVPESEEDGLELDMDNITMTRDNGEELSTNLKLAIQHVSAMEKDDRIAFLSGARFYMNAMMDAESAAFALLGQEMEMDTDELCKLYADTVCYFREQPLRKQVAALETGGTQKEKKDEKPGFKHIMSPYLMALINGYLVEIQEPSRIRDSGVLVGLNEYDQAGAVIHLMNGAKARRHKDALCIMTDNVGYTSCRPIDPSVLRRQGVIIDSTELSETLLKDRTRRNTGCTDTALLNRCYVLWAKVKEYCENASITEGSVSPMELERFVQAVMLDGDDSLEENLRHCVISKATSSVEDQVGILSACSQA